MSRVPDTASVREVIAMVREMESLQERLPTLLRAAEELRLTNERREALFRGLGEKLRSIDLESTGNMGWEGRTSMFLAMAIREIDGEKCSVADGCGEPEKETIDVTRLETPPTVSSARLPLMAWRYQVGLLAEQFRDAFVRCPACNAHPAEDCLCPPCNHNRQLIERLKFQVNARAVRLRRVREEPKPTNQNPDPGWTLDQWFDLLRTMPDGSTSIAACDSLHREIALAHRGGGWKERGGWQG